MRLEDKTDSGVAEERQLAFRQGERVPAKDGDGAG